jgi:hypothetical protein
MNREIFESRSCTRYTKNELRSICDELNIRYLRSDSKATLCDLITLYFERQSEICIAFIRWKKGRPAHTFFTQTYKIKKN